MPSYSPDELKAIAVHFGSYNKAAKALGIGKATLVDAANADLTGRAYTLRATTTDKIYTALKDLPAAAKKDIQQWEKTIKINDGFPNAKRMFMNMKQKDREWARAERERYTEKQLSNTKLWEKISSKLYDRYHWQVGKFGGH